MPNLEEQQDPADEMRADIKRILAHLVGGLDLNGVHHRGLVDRVLQLERALTWTIGVATAIVISVATAVATGHWPGAKT